MVKRIIFTVIAIVFIAGLVLAIEEEWTAGEPVQTDTTNFEWSGGAPYIVTEQAEEEAEAGIFFGINF